MKSSVEQLEPIAEYLKEIGASDMQIELVILKIELYGITKESEATDRFSERISKTFGQ